MVTAPLPGICLLRSGNLVWPRRAPVPGRAHDQGERKWQRSCSGWPAGESDLLSSFLATGRLPANYRGSPCSQVPAAASEPGRSERSCLQLPVAAAPDPLPPLNRAGCHRLLHRGPAHGGS